jgi:hypothetical protein
MKVLFTPATICLVILAMDAERQRLKLGGS